MVSGVSQTRISTVPNSGFGRTSQYKVLDALAMPQACRKAEVPVNSAQLASGGHCPLSGKAETALSRADW
jgi:hypothetical protein